MRIILVLDVWTLFLRACCRFYNFPDLSTLIVVDHNVMEDLLSLEPVQIFLHRAWYVHHKD